MLYMLNDFKYIFVFVNKKGRHSGVNVKDEYEKHKLNFMI